MEFEYSINYKSLTNLFAFIERNLDYRMSNKRNHNNKKPNHGTNMNILNPNLLFFILMAFIFICWHWTQNKTKNFFVNLYALFFADSKPKYKFTGLFSFSLHNNCQYFTWYIKNYLRFWIYNNNNNQPTKQTNKPNYNYDRRPFTVSLLLIFDTAK